MFLCELQMFKLMRVKAKTFELLEVILEETNEASQKLATNVVDNFDKRSATESMMQLWETSRCKDNKKFKKVLEKGLFHGYHALRRLEDYQLC